jgi:hypothetical protein
MFHERLSGGDYRVGNAARGFMNQRQADTKSCIGACATGMLRSRAEKKTAARFPGRRFLISTLMSR